MIFNLNTTQILTQVIKLVIQKKKFSRVFWFLFHSTYCDSISKQQYKQTNICRPVLMCRNKIALWVYRHHTKFWFTLFKIDEPIYIFKNALVKIISMNEILVNRNLKIQFFFCKNLCLAK